MKKTILILAVFVCSYGYSQVGIGTSTPSDKSILDLTATDRGFLLPRVTTALRNAIAPNATTDKGMQVYDTDTASIWYWDGSIWVDTKQVNIYNANGTITGDRTVTQGANNLTFDGAGKMSKTGGNFGIGTANPIYNLEVYSTSETYIGIGSDGGTSKRVGLKFYPWFGNQEASSIFSINDNIGSAHLTFSTSANERLRIHSNGNLGVGTTNPTVRLDTRASVGGGAIAIGDTPLSASAAGSGAIKYNSTVDNLEYSNGSSWQPLAVGNAPKFAQFSANAAQVFNTTGQKVNFPVTTVNVGFTISGNNEITLPQGRIYKVELNLPWAAMAGSFCRFAIYNSTTNAQISQVAHLESATSAGAISGSGFTSTFVNTSSASVVIDVRYLRPNGQNTTLNDLANGQAFATITIQAVD